MQMEIEYNGAARKFGQQLALGFLDIFCLILTDAKTGTEYLVTPDGGIIERTKK